MKAFDFPTENDKERLRIGCSLLKILIWPGVVFLVLYVVIPDARLYTVLCLSPIVATWCWAFKQLLGFLIQKPGKKEEKEKHLKKERSNPPLLSSRDRRIQGILKRFIGEKEE